jgi:mono/diheme cytochrome c family protein
MKHFLFGFVATLALLPAALIGCLRLGAAEVRADVDAPAWQSGLMHLAVRAAVRRSAAGLKSPLAPSAADLIAGRKSYMDTCAGCHGQPGRPPRTRPLFLTPPAFVHVGTQYSVPELFWIIKHGIRRTGMSAYSYCFSDGEIWEVAEFVKRMKNLPP